MALSAFGCFCRGAQQGRFPQLSDRDDLWQLLVTITVQKAIDHIRHERRQKRGAGAVLDEAALAGTRDSGADEPGMEQILGREPTPEFAAQVAEECERLLHCLGEGSLRLIALKKMEGYSDEEIATQLGCARRTVVRKLRRHPQPLERSDPEPRGGRYAMSEPVRVGLGFWPPAVEALWTKRVISSRRPAKRLVYPLSFPASRTTWPTWRVQSALRACRN